MEIETRTPWIGTLAVPVEPTLEARIEQARRWADEMIEAGRLLLERSAAPERGESA